MRDTVGSAAVASLAESTGLEKKQVSAVLAELEGRVERHVRKRLTRGSVTVALVLRRTPEAAVAHGSHD